MHTPVHLVIVFTFPTQSLKKSQLGEDVQNVEEEYKKLSLLLESSGLKVVGRAGRRRGEIVILVYSPRAKLEQLARLEQSSDFTHGVFGAISGVVKPYIRLSPSHRIRLLHDHLTGPSSAGGLGISPGISEWKRVVGVYALHDPEFDQTWVRSLTRGGAVSDHLEGLKDDYGEEVALYFAFLSTYTKSLTPIAVLGAAFHFLDERYSPFYSIVIVLWATFFAEYWAVCERKLAVRWGSYKSSGIKEPQESTETQGSSWWLKDFDKLPRLLVSLAVLLGFMCLLIVFNLVAFMVEAFLAILYKGPGSQLAPIIPTVIFAASAPAVLGIYQSVAIRSTRFERHSTRSSYTYSLTIKRWALSTIVSHLGVILSAFIYMPFGQEVLGLLHLQLSPSGSTVAHAQGGEEELMWEHDLSQASTKLNGSRLQTQMFAFLVTAQLGNAFQELVVPYVIRWFQSRLSPPTSTKGKRPGDRLPAPEKDHRKLLDRINAEVSTRMDYEVFDDYLEMVTQFSYIAIWSSIWPLAPVMASLNNWLEGPSDAFKLATHMRKPIPVRVESIGAWLDSIRGIAWASAVVNTLLVFFYHPDFVHVGMVSYKEGDVKACLLIALTASHAFLALRYVVRVVVDKVYWQYSEEKEKSDWVGRNMRSSYLGACDKTAVHAFPEETLTDSFWTVDEGLEEILRGLKEE